MDQLEQDQPQYEHKAVWFSINKYWPVLTFHFNQDFARRLYNVLKDYAAEFKADDDIKALTENLKHLVGLPDAKPMKQDDCVVGSVGHIYFMVCQKELAFKLNTAFTEFLANKRVSPALFSFCKQLSNELFPQKRFQSGYADDY